VLRRLTVAKSPLHSRRVNERNRLWVLKNSFQGISITKFVRKLLNVRSPQTLEFAEITALVPFSHPRLISPVVSLPALIGRSQLQISTKLVVVVNRPAADVSSRHSGLRNCR